MNDLLTKGDAVFSDCRKYRYDLCRVWDGDKPLFLIIMLNPSTADALKDDPTTRKCLHYARKYGCGRYTAVNLFSFRSHMPKVMKKATDPIGAHNDYHLLKWIDMSIGIPDSIVVVAWGNDGSHLNRDTEVMSLIKLHGITPLCFRTNQNGTPKHPTYLANNLDLIPYKLINHPERKAEE